MVAKNKEKLKGIMQEQQQKNDFDTIIHLCTWGKVY